MQRHLRASVFAAAPEGCAMEDPLSDCSPATVTGVVASATLQRLLTVTVRSPGSRPLLGRMGGLGADPPLSGDQRMRRIAPEADLCLPIMPSEHSTDGDR